MLLIFSDHTECRWEFPALLQPIRFWDERWRPELFSAAQHRDQPQAVIAGPSPVSAAPLRLKDTLLPRFADWKQGVYDYGGKSYVWDSRKGGQHMQHTRSVLLGRLDTERSYALQSSRTREYPLLGHF